MGTPNETLSPNHPAVEVIELAALTWMADTTGKAPSGTAYMLSAALPHLESATKENLARLRNTPAGRALMAEAWDQGAEAGERDYVTALDPDHECIPNPYRKEGNA